MPLPLPLMVLALALALALALVLALVLAQRWQMLAAPLEQRTPMRSCSRRCWVSCAGWGG